MTHILDDKVLVLNKTFFPLRVVSVRAALEALFKEKAVVMDDQYISYSIKDWSDHHRNNFSKAIRTTNTFYIAPEIIRLLDHDQIINRTITLTRQNLFLRDDYTCQYCGTNKDLTWDHVIPKSRAASLGLKKHLVNTWTNLVTCCGSCNSKKADRTPKEANMVLVKAPIRPKELFFKTSSWKPSWKSYFKD